MPKPANKKYNSDVRIGALLLDSEKFYPGASVWINNEDYRNGATECYDSTQIRLVSTLGGHLFGDSYELDGVDVVWYLAHAVGA